MKRKFSIEGLPQDHYKILGINSEEKIWKLSHEINQRITLRLQRVEKEWKNEKEEKKSDPNSLFETPSNRFRKREAEFLYLDEQTFPKYAVILCAGAGHILPKPAKPFRYFLFLRYNGTDYEEQDWLTLTKSLESSPAVLTSCDLSNLQELKNILS